MCKLPVVEKRFSAIAELPEGPTADDVKNGSYVRQDSDILLKNGEKLHIHEGSRRLKLTLVSEMRAKGVGLSSVSVEAMTLAIKEGFLQIDGRKLEFRNARAATRMLEKLKNSQ